MRGLHRRLPHTEATSVRRRPDLKLCEAAGTGVLSDLVVAPLAEAAAVVSTLANERAWTWVAVKGLGIDDLAVIHCLLDGRDPNEPVSPAKWQENFTNEKMAGDNLLPLRKRLRMAKELFVWICP